MRMHRDGVGLACDDAGSGAPPLLLVHGWATDRTLFTPLARRARAEHRAVAVDLRGFGESDAPAQGYSIAGYADDVAYVAAQLDLGPAVVVGHSMGAMVALDLAARYADRVAAVVLL